MTVRRWGGGSKPVDQAQVREAFGDDRIWCGLGIVWKPPGSDSHFDLVEDDCLVEVQLMPSGEPLRCRLGSAAGGEGTGVWRVPPVGTEVGIMIPQGHFDADPFIVCTLSSGDVPSQLDGDTMVILNPKNLRIISSDGDVIVNEGTLRVSRKTDPVAGGTLQATAGPYPVMFVHAPPVVASDSVTNPPAAAPGAVALTGNISDGAEHFKG